MPLAISLGVRVAVSRAATALAIPIGVSVQNSRMADRLGLSVLVTSELGDAARAPFRLFGVAIEMDDGDGEGLRRLTAGELGAAVQLHASLDGIGRIGSFSRWAPVLSPFVSDTLRGQRRVRITGRLGTSPAAMQSRILLNGYVRQASFSASPPVASIEAQDASLLWAEEKLQLTISEGSGSTRAAVVASVLAQYGIPHGALALGPGEGGTIRKAISVGGDANVVEWIRGFLTPTGRRVRFNQEGEIEIGLFAENGPLVRRLGPSEIANLVITPPATSEANQVSMTGTAVTLSATASGMGEAASGGSGKPFITVTDVATLAEYAPQVAPRIQNHLRGAITDRVVVAPPRAAVTARVVTSTKIETFGEIVVITEAVDTYGWYAQRACQFRRDSAGALSYNAWFDVYLFPDGSARAVAEESFQQLTRTTTVKQYASGVLANKRVEVSDWTPAITPFNGTYYAQFCSDAGEVWDDGVDHFTPGHTTTTTTYRLATDGIHLASVYEEVRSYTPASSGIVFSGYTYLASGASGGGEIAETLASSDHAEQYAAATEAVTAPQSLTAVVTDRVRSRLGALVATQQQNDYCETLAELQTAAFFAVRELSKFTVQFDMPIDLMLTEGAVCCLALEATGGREERVVVGTVDWSIDGGTGENSQHITGWYYPLNLSLQ